MPIWMYWFLDGFSLLMFIGAIGIIRYAVERNAQEPDDREPFFHRRKALAEGYATNCQKELPPYWHVRINTRGELAWVFRERGWTGTPQTQTPADLRGVILDGARLDYVLLCGANLREASLHKTRLYRAVMFEADCTRADLSEASLYEALCAEAFFMAANLTLADLRGAELCLTHCEWADFTDATCTGTRFEQAVTTGWNPPYLSPQQRRGIIDAELSSARTGESGITPDDTIAFARLHLHLSDPARTHPGA